MILVTSNENKLQEFRSMGLDISIEKGVDLPEVNSHSENVILYKALSAGVDRVVEDTILEMDNKEIVDIRWKIDSLPPDNIVYWKTTLGYNDGEYIYIYKGIISGEIIKTDVTPEDSFGFDHLFIPDNSEKTLYELSKIGKKDMFSARKRAIIKLRDNNFDKKIAINSIPEWKGDYQGK